MLFVAVVIGNVVVERVGRVERCGLVVVLRGVLVRAGGRVVCVTLTVVLTVGLTVVDIE